MSYYIKEYLRLLRLTAQADDEVVYSSLKERMEYLLYHYISPKQRKQLEELAQQQLAQMLNHKKGFDNGD